MKKILYIVLLCSFVSYSQSEKNVMALQQFQELYNDNKSEAIFQMLSEPFQQKVTLSGMQQLIMNFQSHFGAFNSYTFIEGANGRDTFIGDFENGQQQIGIYVDENNNISGLLFKPVEHNNPPKFERNTTALQLPFKGEWFTYWGGNTKAQNYHVATKVQQGAFDFLKLGPGDKSYRRSGTRNEDYYAFGQPLYAVCDAEVYEVRTGIDDNRPTQMNPAHPLGNSVTLKTANDEYIVYAHFEKGTIVVKKGDRVQAGDYLGNCGNSGNSSEPHLHLHIQDGPNMMTAVGARCYFEEVLVNGEVKKDYSPVKFDRISPIKD